LKVESWQFQLKGESWSSVESYSLDSPVAREYPSAPIVGVGAVVVRDDKALLIKRGQEPRKGEWSLPGGIVEAGESLLDALQREVREETGLDVDIGPHIETFDRIHRDEEGRVRYHFVIVDYLCTSAGGEAIAGTDADAVAWIGADELESYRVNAHAAAVIRKGLALSAMLLR
jgi:8-oxo-dGTP diphosphatase